MFVLSNGEYLKYSRIYCNRVHFILEKTGECNKLFCTRSTCIFRVTYTCINDNNIISTLCYKIAFYYKQSEYYYLRGNSCLLFARCFLLGLHIYKVFFFVESAHFYCLFFWYLFSGNISHRLVYIFSITCRQSSDVLHFT